MAKIEKTTLKRYTGGNPCCGKPGEWVSIYLETESDITMIGKDIKVSNPMGLYSEGDIIPSTASVFGVLQKMATKYTTPIYVEPTIGIEILEGPEPGLYPPGTVLNCTVRVDAVQNDAGEMILLQLFANGEEVTRTDTAQTLEATVSWNLTEPLDLSARYQYADGPIKDDSFGKPYPEGRILAGAIETSAEQGGAEYRMQAITFFGSLLKEADSVVTESDVLSLTPMISDETDKVFLTDIVEVGNNTAVFAIPQRMGEFASISYVEAGNQEVIEIFTKVTMNLHVAPGKSYTEPYNVYYKVWQQPMRQNITLIATMD